MKRPARKVLIALALVALTGAAWYVHLDRALDCWNQGGRWNWDGGFCRLDSLPQRAPD
jgi:hypothetical protein